MIIILIFRLSNNLNAPKIYFKLRLTSGVVLAVFGEYILHKNEKKKWSEEELVSFKNRWKAVTIPVNIKIDTKQTALFLENVIQIIESAKKI